ncbi:MAG: GNAT family acetyltransferase [Rhizobiales bacterium]|nr:GNAT family acetyltransferase [Hyphomicrobiales bacterium]
MSAAAVIIAPLEDGDIDAVVALWECCGLTRPWNDPRSDIAFARKNTNAVILVGKDGDAVVSTAMAGHDGHRGWFYYVAVDSDRQGQGLGRAIMTASETWLRDQGVEKVQLLVRAGNEKVRAFYEALGYGEQPRVLFGKWLDGRPLTP